MDLAPFSAMDDFAYSGFATATISDQPISASNWMSDPRLEIRDTQYKLASRSVDGDGPGTGLTSPTQSHKRNASVAGFDSSPASASFGSPDLNDDHGRADGKRRPVKRACNECRQQKVRYQSPCKMVFHGAAECGLGHILLANCPEPLTCSVTDHTC